MSRLLTLGFEMGSGSYNTFLNDVAHNIHEGMFIASQSFQNQSIF